MHKEPVDNSRFHAGSPPPGWEEFEVLMPDDSVRRVKRIPTLDWETLFYQDCTHPMQNAICHGAIAWRRS